MEFISELSDGREVKLKEVWRCCSGIDDCGTSVEVYDVETGVLLSSIKGLTLPDTEDEDFDIESYMSLIEREMNLQ